MIFVTVTEHSSAEAYHSKLLLFVAACPLKSLNPSLSWTTMMIWGTLMNHLGMTSHLISTVLMSIFQALTEATVPAPVLTIQSMNRESAM